MYNYNDMQLVIMLYTTYPEYLDKFTELNLQIINNYMKVIYYIDLSERFKSGLQYILEITFSLKYIVHRTYC